MLLRVRRIEDGHAIFDQATSGDLDTMRISTSEVGLDSEMHPSLVEYVERGTDAEYCYEGLLEVNSHYKSIRNPLNLLPNTNTSANLKRDFERGDYKTHRDEFLQNLALAEEAVEVAYQVCLEHELDPHDLQSKWPLNPPKDIWRSHKSCRISQPAIEATGRRARDRDQQVRDYHRKELIVAIQKFEATAEDLRVWALSNGLSEVVSGHGRKADISTPAVERLEQPEHSGLVEFEHAVSVTHSDPDWSMIHEDNSDRYRDTVLIPDTEPDVRGRHLLRVLREWRSGSDMR